MWMRLVKHEEIWKYAMHADIVKDIVLFFLLWKEEGYFHLVT
jgi:hypothetical protein